MSADLDVAKARTAEALAGIDAARQALRKLKGREFVHLVGMNRRARKVKVDGVDETRLRVLAVGPRFQSWIRVTELQDSGEAP